MPRGGAMLATVASRAAVGGACKGISTGACNLGRPRSAPPTRPRLPPTKFTEPSMRGGGPCDVKGGQISKTQTQRICSISRGHNCYISLGYVCICDLGHSPSPLAAGRTRAGAAARPSCPCSQRRLVHGCPVRPRHATTRTPSQKLPCPAKCGPSSAGRVAGCQYSSRCCHSWPSAR